jgi:hypothetical protein
MITNFKIYEKEENIGNVIFLDIDGVLIPYDVHSQKVHEYFDDNYKWKKEAVIYINDLIRKTDAKVVITSSYRKKYTKEQITKQMKEEGFEYDVYDMTPALKNTERWEEISKWIDLHKIKKFIIFDDVENEDIIDHFPDNFVMCKHSKGLRLKNYEKALKLFKK